MLTAGTGTLTGIPYLHLTNDFTRAIADTPVDNIVTVTDATLVSITNASAVADRMQAYYACTKTISAPIIALTERPGYVVNVLDPYDQQMVTATLASADITLSRTLRAEENLLVGFTPPSSGEISYETKREVLTGGGSWQRPDGVTTVTYILISGAQGGYAGNSGGPGGDYDHFQYSTGGRTEFGYRYGDAGPGGDGGQPGQGGRILQGELDVSDLQTVAYQCGLGGTGAPSGSTGAGSVGSDTTFGPASSAAGATSDDGYTDPITGDTYAVSGRTGIAGGASAGKIPNQSPAADNILQFQPPRASPPGTGLYITAATLRATETRLLPIPPNPTMRCSASSPPRWAPARQWAAMEPTAPLMAPSQPAAGLPPQQPTDWLEPMHLRQLKRPLLWAVTVATAEEAEARRDCAGLAMSPTAGSLRLLSPAHRDREARAAREDREATGLLSCITPYPLFKRRGLW